MKFAAAIIATAAATVQTKDEKTLMGAEILSGFITSYGGHFNLEALLACIQEEDKALLVADAAYQMAEDAIATGNKEEFVGVAIALFAAYQQAMQGLPACEAVDTTTFKYEQMNQDITYAMTQVNLLKPSEKDFTAEQKAAVKSLLHNDYMQFGEIMGHVAKSLKPVNKQNVKMVAEFLQGYLQATNVGTFNFTALLECIYAADQAAEVADADFNILEEAIEDKDIMEGVMAAIFAFATYQAVEQAIPVCEQVDPSTHDWTTYNKIGQTMKTDAKTIILENLAAFEEIGQTAEAGDIMTAGFQLGTTLKAAVGVETFLY